MEQCELCAAPLDDGHPHLLDVDTDSVRCVCRACAVLFDRSAASNGKLRRIPDRRVALPPVPEGGGGAAWSAIGVPVQIAFVVLDDAGVATVRYPGPAGITRADVGDLAWTELLDEAPELVQLEPEVEAMLVRDRQGRSTRYVVPIDDCFRLVAVMRQSWVGITGGDEMWSAVDQWFDDLAARSRMLVRRGPSRGHGDPEFEASPAGMR